MLATGSCARPQEPPDIPDEAMGRPFPEADPEMPLPPDERLGRAVMGLGAFGPNHVIPVIAHSRRRPLAAFVDASPDAAASVRGAHGVPEARLDDHETFGRSSGNPRMRVVHDERHAPCITRARVVMCEKSMADTVGGGPRHGRASERTGAELVIARHARSEAHDARMSETRPQGAFGRVKLMVGDTPRPRDRRRGRVEDGHGHPRARRGADVPRGDARGAGGLDPPRHLPDDVRPREVEGRMTTPPRFPSGARANPSISDTTTESRIQVLDLDGIGLPNPPDRRGGRHPDRGDGRSRRRQFMGGVDHLGRAATEDLEPGAMGRRGLGLTPAMQASAERRDRVGPNPDGTMREG